MISLRVTPNFFPIGGWVCELYASYAHPVLTNAGHRGPEESSPVGVLENVGQDPGQQPGTAQNHLLLLLSRGSLTQLLGPTSPLPGNKGVTNRDTQLPHTTLWWCAHKKKQTRSLRDSCHPIGFCTYISSKKPEAQNQVPTFNSKENRMDRKVSMCHSHTGISSNVRVPQIDRLVHKKSCESLFLQLGP